MVQYRAALPYVYQGMVEHTWCTTDGQNRRIRTTASGAAPTFTTFLTTYGVWYHMVHIKNVLFNSFQWTIMVSLITRIRLKLRASNLPRSLITQGYRQRGSSARVSVISPLQDDDEASIIAPMEDEDEQNESNSELLPRGLVPSNASHNFIDYVNSGLDIDFCVAIDFVSLYNTCCSCREPHKDCILIYANALQTSSNGDPRIPGTLHYSRWVMNLWDMFWKETTTFIVTLWISHFSETEWWMITKKP